MLEQFEKASLPIFLTFVEKEILRISLQFLNAEAPIVCRESGKLTSRKALSFSKDNVAVFRRGYPPLTDRRYREDELSLEYNMGQMERKRKQIHRYFADTRRKKEMEEGHGEMSE